MDPQSQEAEQNLRERTQEAVDGPHYGGCWAREGRASWVLRQWADKVLLK